MSDYASELDLISESQLSKEVTSNALHDAASPASLFGMRFNTTAGLTWGVIGGRFGGVAIGNQTVTLTASATNYVVIHRTTLVASVATTTTNWDDEATYGRAYKITTGTSAPTDWEDHRAGEFGILGSTVLIDSGGGSGGPGGGGGFGTPLESHTASSSAELLFTSWYDAAFKDYVIVCEDIIPATDGADLILRMSVDGGSSYDSGAAVYATSMHESSSGGSAVSGNQGTHSITVMRNCDNGTTNSSSGTYWLYIPGSTARYKKIAGLGAVNTAGSAETQMLAGHYKNDAQAVNALRFAMSSGNIATGTIAIYGVATQ